MTHDALRKRYTYLWTGETVAATLFAALLLWSVWNDGVWQHWVARGYSVGVVVVILAQGVAWWRLKLRLLQQNQHQIPLATLRIFQQWRRINGR